MGYVSTSIVAPKLMFLTLSDNLSFEFLIKLLEGYDVYYWLAFG